MADRALVLFLVAAWLPAGSLLIGCRDDGERAGSAQTRAPAAEAAAARSDPFLGVFRVRGMTTDEVRGDSRRIEGIVVISENPQKQGSYSTSAELETKYPSSGGPVDAQVIGTGSGERLGDKLNGATQTQLVMSTVPGVDTGFAWVPRSVGPRLVSTWEAYFRKDGTLVVEIRNEPAEGVEYSPTRTTLYGTRIE